jgi:hypothetical protein
LKDVLKLYNKTLLATPTSDNKMVLYNPTTNDYNYSDIPSSSGTSYPYLEPTRINLTSVDQGLYDKSIIADSLNSTITCRSKSISGRDNYMQFLLANCYQKTYDPEILIKFDKTIK